MVVMVVVVVSDLPKPPLTTQINGDGRESGAVGGGGVVEVEVILFLWKQNFSVWFVEQTTHDHGMTNGRLKAGT